MIRFRRYNLQFLQKRIRQKWKWLRKPAAFTTICIVTLFALALISLFSGSLINLELNPSQFLKRSSFFTKERRHFLQVNDIWKSEFACFYHGCADSGPHFHPAIPDVFSNGYLLIAASGGLNQQRVGISDAVVVARILNATLVVPELDHYSYWKDKSDFLDIFDVDWFISSLSKDVTIVKRVPQKVMRSMEKPPYTMRVPRRSSEKYFLDEVLPVLLRRRVVQLTKFDFRLSNNLNDELQKLRCRANYHSLRFSKPIRDIGQKLVSKMRWMSGGRYIAVHLRFEPDMLAFLGCYYGGDEKQRNELNEIRKRWATLPNLSAEGESRRGKCPLTPHEVGLMLRGLGFSKESFIYVASGEIYGGNKTLDPFRDLFPNIFTKDMLAGDELAPFMSFSSRLAAIDYIVCDESDVFATNNNGNMAKVLAGRRRYMGHKRTIRPNAKKISSLMKARNEMEWDEFAAKVRSCQKGFMGEPDEMRPGRGDFHEFPSSCICEKPRHINSSLTCNNESKLNLLRNSKKVMSLDPDVIPR